MALSAGSPESAEVVPAASRAQRELAGALAGHADAELAAARAEAALALQRLAALEQRVEGVQRARAG